MGGLMPERRGGRRGLLLMSLGSLMACSPPPPSASPPTAPSQTRDSLAVQAGGWTETDPFSQDVQEAARFAVQRHAIHTHSRLIYKDVKAAQTQVVEGQNFQMHVTVFEQGLSRSAAVTVWKNLQNQYTLTHWQWNENALPVPATP
jgi:hypothetical protein